MDQRSEELIREIKSISEDLKSRMTELLKMQNDQGAVILEEQKNRMMEMLDRQSSLFEKQEAQMQELVETQKGALEELLHDTEDFTHKESVKVYRNVQAVIESALPKQTEEITEALINEMKNKGISGGFKVIWVLTLIAALANVAVEVLRFLGYI